MAEQRQVILRMDSVTQMKMQHATDHDEWFRAVGRLSTWNMSFPTVDIRPDGETDMVAVYKDENDNVKYVIGAVWHDDHYGFHS